MSHARGTLARAANRAAMFASIFVAGAIAGWVASERGLLSAPWRPGVAAAQAADTIATAGDPAGDSVLVGVLPMETPPATAPRPTLPVEPAPATPAGEVAVGPAAVDDDGRRTPVPTRAELEALRRSLVVPVAGVERSALRGSFDERRGGGSRAHHAIDILAPRGTPVVSAAGGRLLKLFTSEAGGLMIYASEPTGRFVLVYSHLDAYADDLREGMTLRAGQRLGTVGTTGNAPANVPHLHFAIARTDDPAEWWRGTPVDPHALLAP